MSNDRMFRSPISVAIVLCLVAGIGRSCANPVLLRDCDPCLKIRVGLPRIVKGPAADIADNRFTEIQLPGGGFRGFDAHGTTRAIDGHTPSDMGGPGRTVLGPGKPGTYDACGQWLNHAEVVGRLTIGFVHDETSCKYQIGQTHKSMSVATSADYGLTWAGLGQIITGPDAPAAGRNTGEGDCTVVDAMDSYFYAYCFRPRDGGLIVARAPVADPAPGKWTKYLAGEWREPGLGGQATRLMNGSGVSAARWSATGQLVLTGWVAGGLGLIFTSDRTSLHPLGQPLLIVDPGEWRRPAPSELISYPVLLDAKTGSNQLSDAWLLVYAYVPPNAGADQKYLVFRDVTVAQTAPGDDPQIAVLLARWYNAAQHDHWSTTAAVPNDNGRYLLEARSGYLMTSAPAGAPATALEDCVSYRPGHPDHLLATRIFCQTHGYQRLRTAGWLFSQKQPHSQPLYRCYSGIEQSHFASNRADCENLGKAEALLGYDVTE